MNNFILSYNPISSAPSHGQILNHVQISRYVSSYYHAFPGTYVLKSEQTATFLTESLKGLFELSPFMVTQVWANHMGGTLPQDVWHWINFGYVPAAAAVAPDNNALASYLSGRSDSAAP